MSTDNHVISRFTVNGVPVTVFDDRGAMGRAAAGRAAAAVRDRLTGGGRARIIVGSAPSQAEVIGSLAAAPGLDWSRIDVFHMDEYVGIDADHPASFRKWLREHLVDIARPAIVHYLDGEAPDPEAECRRYAALLDEAPIDVVFLGFGENGHIAFNDPRVADFDDPLRVKIVEMDEACRLQQVGEGHFPDLASVPRRAITLTCPVLLGAAHAVAVVPTQRKAEAARRAIAGPVSTDCPASALFNHPRAALYMDRDAASLLDPAILSGAGSP